MKKSITLTKRLHVVVFMFFCCSLLLSAQVSKTINLTAEGTLQNLLTSTEKSSVTNLNVTTDTGVYLNEADFATLNAMPSLVSLDLSGSRSKMGTSLDVIPANAFKDNKTIKTFVFPTGVMNMGEGCFTNCAFTGVFTIPGTIKGTANVKGRIYNCPGITAFDVDASSTTMKSINGVIFSLDGTTLALYPGGKTDATYSIPAGTTTVLDGAFGLQQYITELSFPASLTTFGTTTGVNVVTGTSKLKAFKVDPLNNNYGSMTGILFDKVNKSLSIYPMAFAEEALVIDGSQVTKVPQFFFQNALKLKSVTFTEGLVDIGYCAFKAASSVLEYVELPASLLTIQGEAFANCSSIKQIICKATTPPDILNNATFRGPSGTAGILIGVPAGALAAYQASKWIATVYVAGQGFKTTNFVAYRTITTGANTICNQSVGAPTKQVSVTAGTGSAGQGFSYWDSTPTVQFANKNSPSTLFTMPDANVTINAVFTNLKPYTIIDGLTASGNATVGSVVTISASATKDGNTFKRWEVVDGVGVVVGDPTLTNTSFTMVDGTVTIRAIYEKSYTINIEGGYADLEAFVGETVIIKAEEQPVNVVFDHWTTTTAGLVIANVNSSNTSFVMPACDVNIKANFITVSGIDEKKDFSLSMYPNPASENITLNEAEGQDYKIYDMKGRLLLQGTNHNLQPIYVGHLTNGAYLLKVSMKTILFLKK